MNTNKRIFWVGLALFGLILPQPRAWADTHNFAFEFGSDTLLKQLNWNTPSGLVKRVVWDEFTRFNTNDGPPSTSWVRHYFHSPSAGDPTLMKTGWRYNLNHEVLSLSDCETQYGCAEMVEDIVTTSKADISYEFEIAPSQLVGDGTNLHNDSHLRIRAESAAIRVSDDIEFTGQTIRITMTVTNLLSQEIKALEVPFYLGSLMIGNFNLETRKINAVADLSRLRPFRGGMIQHHYSDSNGAVWDMYPVHHMYSPVAALWGDAKFVPGSAEDHPGEVVVGGQLLTNIELPTQFGFQQSPRVQHSPTLNGKVIVKEFQPNESRAYTFAFTFAEGDDNWQGALQTYQQWFKQEYGSFNPETGAFEAIPNYCPTGPIEYLVGANAWPAFDWDTARFTRVPDPLNPGETLPRPIRDIFSSDRSAAMSQLGLKRFGIWHTTLSSRYLTSTDPNDPNNCMDWRCDLSGNSILLDPNIDASEDVLNPDPDISVLRSFTNDYAANNMDVFWYLRPCVNIEGADILYDGTENPTFVQGVMNWDVDLRVPANRDRAIEIMDHFVARGVKGLYFDAHSCRGDTDLMSYAKQTFRDRYGADLFILKEGAMDRDSLLWAQLPIVKTPNYDPSHSVLIDFLVPDGTYYGGEINSVLSDEELLDVLDRGYQAIPYSGPSEGPNTWLCHLIRKSNENYHEKWVNYGQVKGCPEPILMPPACENYPEIYFTVEASAGPHGTISPSGSQSFMEGSMPTFTITPDSGYHISVVRVDGVPLPEPVAEYKFFRIAANHTINAEFEENAPPPTNQAPHVSAGDDQTVLQVQFVNLNGIVTDDGLPANPGHVTVAWSQAGGAGSVIFAEPSQPVTTAQFSNIGPYVLRLTATDGALTSFDEIQVLVFDPSVSDEVLGSRTKFITCMDPNDPFDRAYIPACYFLADPGPVTLAVFTTAGEEVKILKNETRSAGLDMVLWDRTNAAGKAVASGLYVFVLETENEKLIQKAPVLK